jgi:Myosin head (motor domain)
MRSRWQVFSFIRFMRPITHVMHWLKPAVYSRLLDFIVHRINQSISFQSSSSCIGVLDIVGFEYTQNKSILYRVPFRAIFHQWLQRETATSETETASSSIGVSSKKRSFSTKREVWDIVNRMVYVDNRDCIELIDTKNNGIFHLLDEEYKFPSSSRRITHASLEFIFQESRNPFLKGTIPPRSSSAPVDHELSSSTSCKSVSG